MQMMLFKPKVEQYFPVLACQINFGFVSELVLWEYISIIGSANFKDKNEGNVLLVLEKLLFQFYIVIIWDFRRGIQTHYRGNSFV